MLARKSVKRVVSALGTTPTASNPTWLLLLPLHGLRGGSSHWSLGVVLEGWRQRHPATRARAQVDEFRMASERVNELMVSIREEVLKEPDILKRKLFQVRCQPRCGAAELRLGQGIRP